MKTSTQIKYRLIQEKKPFNANDNIAEHLNPEDREGLRAEVEEACQNLLDALVIDTQNDHNTKDTATRMAKMYLEELFKGRYEAKPKVTDFPNVSNLDEIYTLGPITVRSCCSHHFVPITGRAWIGILPSRRVIGISKFVRLANWVLSRPQIQEEATVQLADLIEKEIQPNGLAIVIEATHNCMTLRGVKESETVMKSSVMRGAFRNDPEARMEFLSLIK